MRMLTCHDCRFYAPSVPGDEVGHCRRENPKKGRVFFPEVYGFQEWCGNLEPLWPKDFMCRAIAKNEDGRIFAFHTSVPDFDEKTGEWFADDGGERTDITDIAALRLPECEPVLAMWINPNC